MARVEMARSHGKTIVQCHGCFDIVHPGHIRYLEFARRQGDVLIVSLTGDSGMDKGPQRPYIPQELRAENLAALMFVDYVYINPAPIANEVLSRIRPEFYVKGREYEHSTDSGFLSEKNVVEEYGGRIIFSSGEIVFSSSELIEQMPHNNEAESQHLQIVCRRHEIDSQTINQTLDRFRDLRVLVVGDIVIDRYVLCDAMGVASESPMMSLVHRDERSYVGGAAVVARHVAALGAKAFLLSAGCKDEQGAMVANVLMEEGVESELIECRPAMVEKTRFLAEDTKLFKVDRAQRQPLDSVAERQAAAILEKESKVADAVIFCDFGYGMITGSLLNRILPTLRHNVSTITADVSGGRNSLLDFRHVDLLCPTEREVRATLNDHDSGLSSIAWNLLAQTQAKNIFVTLAKHGMVVFERGSQDRQSAEWSGRLKSEQLPAFNPHVVDLLGCGDAMLSASTLALAAKASLMQTAYLGNATAAIEAATPGNQPISSQRLRDWLRNRHELQQTSSTQTATDTSSGLQGASCPKSKPVSEIHPENVNPPSRSISQKTS